MLVIAYHLLAQGTYYDEQRYAEQQPKRAERERKRAINALERLGYTVTVQRVASLQGLRADRVSVSPPAVGRVRETSIQLARVSCAFSESGISWEPHQSATRKSPAPRRQDGRLRPGGLGNGTTRPGVVSHR